MTCIPPSALKRLYAVGLLTLSAATAHSELGAKLQQFNPVIDYESVIHQGNGNLLLVNKDLPVKTLADFFAYIKIRPASSMYCSSGRAPAAMEDLAKQASVQMHYVPYKSIAPCIRDLTSGLIDAAYADAASTQEFIRAGHIRVLAIAKTTANDTGRAGDKFFVQAGSIAGNTSAPNNQTIAETRVTDASHCTTRLNYSFVDNFGSPGTDTLIIEELERKTTSRAILEKRLQGIESCLAKTGPYISRMSWDDESRAEISTNHRSSVSNNMYCRSTNHQNKVNPDLFEREVGEHHKQAMRFRLEAYQCHKKADWPTAVVEGSNTKIDLCTRDGVNHLYEIKQQKVPKFKNDGCEARTYSADISKEVAREIAACPDGDGFATIKENVNHDIRYRQEIATNACRYVPPSSRTTPPAPPRTQGCPGCGVR
jgi:hypothetical protein